ncbi:MAG: DUF4837 family protein [candidate division KSB1 bacterium]|nr:DUF4837 family protein [candidate division KSB1 bacterium]
MRRASGWISMLIVFALIAGCSMKRQSIGSRNKIVVISDTELYSQIEPELDKAFGVEYITPQIERVFSLELRQPEELASLQRFPHLLIVGTLASEGKLGELIDKFLSPASRQRVEQDSAFMFSKKNPWATDQLLAVLVSRDVETLKRNIDKHAETLFDLFDRHEQEVVFNNLYLRYEQKQISKALMEKHGWSVRVQHDYFVAIDSSEARFVWLRRLMPQRWLAVYWEENADPATLSKEWMLERRAWFGEKFYDGDFVYEDSTLKVKEAHVNFCGRYAVRLDGVWQNAKHDMGGPFRSYGFYNESDKRLYLIDLAVYAPGERKWQYIRQLDGIASTFTVKGEQK